MSDAPKIFTPSNATGVAGVEQANAATSGVNGVTASTASEYAPGSGEAAANVRKPRSDKGRPRGKRVMAGDAPTGQTMDSAPGGQVVGFTVDKEIVEQTALTVFKTVDGVLTRKVGATTIRLGGDVEFAKELAQNAGLSIAEGDLMAKLTGIIFEKHGLLTGYAPELLLGVLLAEWGTRVALVLSKLNQLAAKRPTKSNADSPSPDKNNR